MTVEPGWWSRARELKDRGLGLYAIAHEVGRDHYAIRYALDSAYRAKLARKSRQRYLDGKLKPGRSWDNKRRAIVLAAHDEAKAKGEHVDAVLAKWGEPVRHGQRAAR